MNNNEITKALDTLKLPPLITKADIKKQYRHLAKISHPDSGGSTVEMEKLNSAYELLMNYVDNFRFSFSEDEIRYQHPQDFYSSIFKP